MIEYILLGIGTFIGLLIGICVYNLKDTRESSNTRIEKYYNIEWKNNYARLPTELSDEVKIYRLKDLISYIGKCKLDNKKIMTDFIPAFSNYLLSTNYNSNYSWIVEVHNYFLPSRTLLKKHLELGSISNACYLGLSKEQQEFLELNEKKENKEVQTTPDNKETIKTTECEPIN
jgi:hypothetical protein